MRKRKRTEGKNHQRTEGKRNLKKSRDERTLQRRFDHPGSRGNVDGQQEINERWFGSHGFDARSNETREIFTEDELRPRGTLQGSINGRCRGRRTVQRDSLCGTGLRVPQAGQERLRKRDGTTRQGNGDPQRREGEVVREDRGKEEQDSTSETEASGRKQRSGRRERCTAQPEGGPGRPMVTTQNVSPSV